MVLVMSEPPNADASSANEIHDTPIRPIVKEKRSATGRKFEIKLKDHVLWALEEYAKENKLSNSQAFSDLLEFRLFQLGKLPEWWYERGKLLR